MNEFPNFVQADGRCFISQKTGNLYIAKTEASDLGNYSCFASSHMDFTTKSVFSTFSQLILVREGQCFPDTKQLNIRSVKDYLGLRVPDVYHIPCNCGWGIKQWIAVRNALDCFI